MQQTFNIHHVGSWNKLISLYGYSLHPCWKTSPNRYIYIYTYYMSHFGGCLTNHVIIHSIYKSTWVYKYPNQSYKSLEMENQQKKTEQPNGTKDSIYRQDNLRWLLSTGLLYQLRIYVFINPQLCQRYLLSIQKFKK